MPINYLLSLCLIANSLVLCANPYPPLFVQWANELGWKGTIDSTGCWDLVPPQDLFQEHWRFMIIPNAIEPENIDILPCGFIFIGK